MKIRILIDTVCDKKLVKRGDIVETSHREALLLIGYERAEAVDEILPVTDHAEKPKGNDEKSKRVRKAKAKDPSKTEDAEGKTAPQPIDDASGVESPEGEIESQEPMQS